MSGKSCPDFSELRLAGRTIFNGEVISVCVDKVRLPDGGSSSREVVRHPGAAVILPMLDRETVLLEWQFRYPLGRHIWEIPAGKLEDGEDPRSAAERELLEETGYVAERWDFMLAMETSPGFCDERAFLYLARELKHRGHPGEADEFVATTAMPLRKAQAMITSGEISDAKTIVALLWLAQQKF